MQRIDIQSPFLTQPHSDSLPTPTLYQLTFPTVLESNQPIDKWKIFKISLAIVFFPIGLAWIAGRIAAVVLFRFIGWVTRNAIVHIHFEDPNKPEYTPSISGIDGVGAEYIIIPSTTTFNKNIIIDNGNSMNWPVYDSQIAKEEYIETVSNLCTSIALQLPNQPKLDAMISWANSEGSYFDLKNHKISPDSRWIIFYQANGAPYEFSLGSEITINFIKEHNKKGYNLLFFNYRGVMDSEGYPHCAEDLIMDGHAPIQFLKEWGVPYTNMLLYGNSLGGAIAIKVAAKCPGTHVVNHHSFSVISKVIPSSIYPQGIAVDITSLKPELALL